MTDQQAADTYVNSQLAADGTLTALLPLGAGSIYNQSPPPGIAPPYIVFNAVPLPDGYVNGNVLWSVTFNVSVQFVTNAANTTKLVSDQAGGLINTDLFNKGGLYNGWWINCQRKSPINLAPSLKDKVLYRYVGGNYEILMRPQSTPS